MHIPANSLLRKSEQPLPTHFLVHISDTHFLDPAEGPLYGVAHYQETLAALLRDVSSTGVYPEALIFSGDLADTGDAQAYARLRTIVEPFANAMGAQIIWAMGNHDDRANFRAQLLDEPASSDTAPCDYVTWIGGLRIIALDSTVPGEHYGVFERSQLEWLRDELATPAPEGTLLVMHHPPVPCVQELAVSVELKGQAALADVLRGTDVRAILAGHLHYSTFTTFAGIPVSVATSSCYTQDLLTPHRGVRGRDEFQGFHYVHVYPESVMHSVVLPRNGRTVGEEIWGAQD